MDMTGAAQDIQELVHAFAQVEGRELSHMKELWQARRFSFIHEACPKDVTQDFFMQALYSSALGFVVGDRAIAWKIGGLYVLYMLYETQLTEKRFKIYLSLEELEQLCILVKELKRHDCVVALKVIKFMLQRKVFLYGCVAINQRSIADSCDKLAAQAASRLHHARNRLLSNLPIQEHLYTDLTQDLLLDDFKHIDQEYEAAKNHVLTGLGTYDRVVDMPSFQDSNTTLGEELKEMVSDWDLQRKPFCPLPLDSHEEELVPQKRQRQKRGGEVRPIQQVRTEDDLLADEIMGLLE
ncbi:unnamed protein product [Sphagnum jensenii]|uniref:snRNA-activating protein complex subunit 1 n=1 Tax=Sphagnum jensenii TaxID=128206 RepID=A0ABP0WM32_9BRYO